MVLLCGAIGATNGLGAQTDNKKICTENEANLAYQEADTLKNWDAAYASFKRFGHCDDGAIAEGYSDSIVKLMALDWKQLEGLARLAEKDASFKNFVLRHVDETASYDDLITVVSNARTRCPEHLADFCKLIEVRARADVSSLQGTVIPILGILEDNPGQYAGEPSFRAVRAIFQKSGDEWKPYRTDCREQSCLKTLAAEYPQEVTWTIAFDGKNLGQVTTRAPSEFKAYAYMGLEEITSGDTVPTVGKRSSTFAGFAGGDVYRPLVAVSLPNFHDPEIWKPAQLSEDLRAALRKEFRKKFPKASNCRNPDENKIRPWFYHDEDIRIGKSYSSNKNWSVAQLNLTGWRCDGPEDDGGPFDGQWYVVEPQGAIRFLDTGMWLVDAGDYDNDGKSEVVFAIGRYDLGGYEIFYDDFKKHAVFSYIFH
jgi:hypothetical protein